MNIVINKKKYAVVVMDTFFKRFLGLMFKKTLITDIYLFPRCSSIHTFFMKQPIDVCMLDKNYRVTFLKRCVYNRKVIIGKGFYTLEMPVGSLDNVEIGDILKIKEQ